jgi:hypothetical protein
MLLLLVSKAIKPNAFVLWNEQPRSYLTRAGLFNLRDNRDRNCWVAVAVPRPFGLIFAWLCPILSNETGEGK